MNLGDAVGDALGVRQPARGSAREWLELQPFQQRFLREALKPSIRTAALCLARGNGKSTLMAWLAQRILTPGDPLFTAGTESHLVAFSLSQACRTTFGILRRAIESDPAAADWKVVESYQQAHVMHRETRTKVSVIPSTGKAAQGLVDCPWVIADEPGAWEINGGQLLHEAIQGAQGKPGCKLRAIYIGTLWPHAMGPGHWWYDLVHGGSRSGVYVQALVGDRKRAGSVRELRRVNPLKRTDPEAWRILLEEHAESQADSRKRASFSNQMLNCPSADEATALLDLSEWERVLDRPVPVRGGVEPDIDMLEAHRLLDLIAADFDDPSAAHLRRETRDGVSALLRLWPRVGVAGVRDALARVAADWESNLRAAAAYDERTRRAVSAWLAAHPPASPGLPIVGVDLGGGRAWSAAAGVWESGRVEAVALAPGVPDLEAQERRDRVPGGTYQRLEAAGSLVVAPGLRVPPVSLLVQEIVERWGGCAGLVCDRFRLPELQDAVPLGWGVEARVNQWSNATEDIRGLRRQVSDGALAVAEGSRALLTWSVGMARVRADDSGNVKIEKNAKLNTSRDDVAVALALAVGAFDRWLRSRQATSARCF